MTTNKKYKEWVKVIQVKEFINYQKQDEEVNKWLKEHSEIEVIDIKYSVSTFQENRSCDASDYSGILIVYKAK
jgi:hypothetical protein